ncbi:hypothetical protein LXA43DRAFT_1067075 [Ganoderma leucocontextum]|nr:hypothetical protein LXA43DRAFT_1067075 [Ganoderma leucocontextum]
MNLNVYGTSCRNGDYLLLTPFAQATSVYDPHQLAKYLDVEDLARDAVAKGQPLDMAKVPIPGGLTSFTAAWNEDQFCRYGMSGINLADGVITVDPRPPPPRELLIPTLARQMDEEDPHKLSLEERKLFAHMQKASAKREVLRTNLSSKKHEERVTNRNKKARAAVYEKGMQNLANVVRTHEGILDDVFDDALLTVPSTPIALPGTPPLLATTAAQAQAGPSTSALSNAVNAILSQPTAPSADSDVNMQAPEPVATQ